MHCVMAALMPEKEYSLLPGQGIQQAGKPGSRGS